MINEELKSTRIAVFLGGVSSEREISLKSGEAVYNALKGLGLDVVKVDIKTTAKFEINRLLDLERVDLVFIALHGEFGEDGKLQKILEELNMPYTGSDSVVSKLAMDKTAAKKMFANAGLDVPESLLISDYNQNSQKEIETKIGFPLMVKPSCCGSSIGLSLVRENSDLDEAVNLAKKFDNSVIIEKFIKGRELTVGILDNVGLPPIEIVTDEPFFNYEAKYKSQGTRYIVPAELDPQFLKKLKDCGVRAHTSLGCNSFSRVDMILSDNNIFILEVNTIPGLTERSLLPKAARCVGIDFPELCIRIIKSARLIRQKAR
jgi:D-alanine-D-alanine ligase